MLMPRSRYISRVLNGGLWTVALMLLSELVAAQQPSFVPAESRGGGGNERSGYASSTDLPASGPSAYPAAQSLGPSAYPAAQSPGQQSNGTPPWSASPSPGSWTGYGTTSRGAAAAGRNPGELPFGSWQAGRGKLWRAMEEAKTERTPPMGSNSAMGVGAAWPRESTPAPYPGGQDRSGGQASGPTGPMNPLRGSSTAGSEFSIRPQRGEPQPALNAWSAPPEQTGQGGLAAGNRESRVGDSGYAAAPSSPAVASMPRSEPPVAGGVAAMPAAAEDPNLKIAQLREQYQIGKRASKGYTGSHNLSVLPEAPRWTGASIPQTATSGSAAGMMPPVR